jgi:hypothetical protein
MVLKPAQRNNRVLFTKKGFDEPVNRKTCQKIGFLISAGQE